MELPNDLYHKIMLYVSHPMADLFKEAIKDKVDELNEIIPGDYEYGGVDYKRGDDISFAHHYFHRDNDETETSR